MNSTQIRGIFEEISQEYGKNEKEKSIIYQFLNRITAKNTDEEITKIIDILKK